MELAAKYLTAAYLVAWSATTISAARASHFAISRVLARLARAVEVRHATSAQPGMLPAGADVRAVMPAAVALGLRAREDPDAHVGQHGADGVRRCAVLDPRLRRDEHEPQVIGE